MDPPVARRSWRYDGVRAYRSIMRGATVGLWRESRESRDAESYVPVTIDDDDEESRRWSSVLVGVAVSVDASAAPDTLRGMAGRGDGDGDAAVNGRCVALVTLLLTAGSEVMLDDEAADDERAPGGLGFCGPYSWNMDRRLKLGEPTANGVVVEAAGPPPPPARCAAGETA